MRRLPLLLAVSALLAACGGGGESLGPTGETAPSAPSSPTPSATPSPVPSPEPPSPSPEVRPIPPVWAMPIEHDRAADDLEDSELVPPDAELVGRVTLPEAGDLPDQVAVTYRIGNDPFTAEHGFAVWQRFEDAPFWSVVHAFVDAPQAGVLGIELQVGDVTGDGHDDVLTFEQTGGTGACGRWRVVAATQNGTDRLFQRRTCDTDIRLIEGRLEVREAVYAADDPHCCPSSYRFTTLQWDGARFATTEVREEPAQG